MNSIQGRTATDNGMGIYFHRDRTKKFVYEYRVEAANLDIL